MATSNITPQQIKLIHVLLNQGGIMSEKKMLVCVYTNNRVTSTKDMTQKEADKLIGMLKETDPRLRMRKKVYALAYRLDMIYGNTPEDFKMNQAKLDGFLLTRGAVKKKLNALSFGELNKVVSQFEKMCENSEKNAFNQQLNGVLQSNSIG